MRLSTFSAEYGRISDPSASMAQEIDDAFVGSFTANDALQLLASTVSNVDEFPASKHPMVTRDADG